MSSVTQQPLTPSLISSGSDLTEDQAVSSIDARGVGYTDATPVSIIQTIVLETIDIDVSKGTR